MTDQSVLVLPGDCGVRAIRSLHAEVVAALEVATDLRLDCADVAHADVAFVQLVLAAAGTAARQAKTAALANPSQIVLSAFARAGLAPPLVPAH